ncbi:uncharacterized protein LOC129571100, partial [Sitodiplosis mosellana]|uniref:uncharacterized protein LOC129571100 n=1 Tax=Sitodiplosis mosellana TaxID=263140 RepID=UPI002443C07F
MNNKNHIEKLNNHNYFSWKYQMELTLIAEDLWEVKTNEAPEQQGRALNRWTKKDNKARALIGLAVEKDQLVHDDNIENHMSQLISLFQKLENLGAATDEQWKIGMILASLPNIFAPLVTALEAREEQDLPMNLVQMEILDEYQRQQESIDDDKIVEEYTVYLCREGVINQRPEETNIDVRRLCPSVSNQHGFMSNRNIQTNLMAFTIKANEAFERKAQLDVFYADIKKAFDTVNQSLLMRKLANFPLSNQVLSWIKSYFAGRKQFVRVGSATSDASEVPSSVGQGTVLGPLFFSAFFNDSDSNDDPTVSFNFADDKKKCHIVVKPEDSIILQESIDKFLSW